jgi:hypothetical protein
MRYVSFDAPAFLEGVIGLNAQERGFYITLIALNYARARKNGSNQWIVGDVTDDLICKAVACRPQTWRKIKRALILKGKMSESEGKLEANRVQTEVSRLSFRGHFGQNQGFKSAIREGKEEREKNSLEKNSSLSLPDLSSGASKRKNLSGPDRKAQLEAEQLEREKGYGYR